MKIVLYSNNALSTEQPFFLSQWVTVNSSLIGDPTGSICQFSSNFAATNADEPTSLGGKSHLTRHISLLSNLSDLLKIIFKNVYTRSNKI